MIECRLLCMGKIKTFPENQHYFVPLLLWIQNQYKTGLNLGNMITVMSSLLVIPSINMHFSNFTLKSDFSAMNIATLCFGLQLPHPFPFNLCLTLQRKTAQSWVLFFYPVFQILNLIGELRPFILNVIFEKYVILIVFFLVLFLQCVIHF